MYKKLSLNKTIISAMVKVMEPSAKLINFLTDALVEGAYKLEDVRDSLEEAIKAKKELLSEIPAKKGKKQSKIKKYAIQGVKFLIAKLEKLEDKLENDCETDSHEDVVTDSHEEVETQKTSLFKNVFEKVSEFANDVYLTASDGVEDIKEFVLSEFSNYRHSVLSKKKSKLKAKRRDLRAREKALQSKLDGIESSDYYGKDENNSMSTKIKSLFKSKFGFGNPEAV